MAQNELKGKIELFPGTLIEGSSLIGHINIGVGSIVHKASLHGTIGIDRYTSLWGPGIQLYGDIEIGSFCSIAHNTSIITFSHNLKRPSTYYLSRNFFKEQDPEEILEVGKVILGSDVWIGSNVQILPNVSIGHGAIVGAGAVVTKDVMPFSIVAGNPARFIKLRFDTEIISKMLKLKWWDWDESQLHKNKSFFRQNLSIASLESVLEK